MTPICVGSAAVRDVWRRPPHDQRRRARNAKDRGALRVVAAALLVFAVAATGCSDARGRAQARTSLIAQLVESGVSSTIAACIVDAFFEGKSDDDLQAFYARDRLTDAERAEFVSLGARCGG